MWCRKVLYPKHEQEKVWKRRRCIHNILYSLFSVWQRPTIAAGSILWRNFEMPENTRVVNFTSTWTKLFLWKRGMFFFSTVYSRSLSFQFQIQVQVRIPGKTGSIPTEILGEVQRSVEEKIGDYKKYWYEIGYKCQNGMLNAEDDNSFIAKEKFPVSKVICEKCKFKDKHYVDNKICWVDYFYIHLKYIYDILLNCFFVKKSIVFINVVYRYQQKRRPLKVSVNICFILLFVLNV